MTGTARTAGAVSFDLFGTLVDVERPADPAASVATELRTRDIEVPDDWSAAFAEPHLTYADGQERPLGAHVAAALASRRRGADAEVLREAADTAVRAAYDQPVETRPGAVEAVDRLAEGCPLGVTSNCSVRGLVEQSLHRSDIDADRFDAVVSSVDCGWRKPDRRAFTETARALDVAPGELVHVGDDPEADGGITDLGGRFVAVENRPVSALLPAIDSLLEAP
jgi:HAD superfamily hydrolase (TIGR01549 family)